MAKYDTDPVLRAAATSPEVACDFLAGAIAVGVEIEPNPDLIGGYLNYDPADLPTAYMRRTMTVRNEGEQA